MMLFLPKEEFLIREKTIVSVHSPIKRFKPLHNKYVRTSGSCMRPRRGCQCLHPAEDLTKRSTEATLKDVNHLFAAKTGWPC